jgi:hypothetical protein
MGRRVFLAVLAAGVFSAGAAAAHEGHEHKAMGTLNAVNADKNQIEMKTVDGKTLVVSVSPATRYKKGSAAAALKDLQAGQRVAVSYQSKGSELLASEVLIGVVDAPKP